MGAFTNERAPAPHLPHFQAKSRITPPLKSSSVSFSAQPLVLHTCFHLHPVPATPHHPHLPVHLHLLVHLPVHLLCFSKTTHPTLEFPSFTLLPKIPTSQDSTANCLSSISTPPCCNPPTPSTASKICALPGSSLANAIDQFKGLDRLLEPTQPFNHFNISK